MGGISSHRVSGRCGNTANSAIIATSRSVFWQAHPTTIRMLLGLSSLGWALSLLYNIDVLDNYPYQLMLEVMSARMWLVGFLLHFVGVFWRIYDDTPRVRWALVINTLGCFMWMALTVCITMRAGRILPGSCLEIITCAFAAWALIRTGLGKDVGTP